MLEQEGKGAGRVYVTVRDRPGAAATGERGSPVATRVTTTVVVLGIVSLLTDISSEMVAAILPLYLTAEMGFGMRAYGMVDGVHQGVSALVRLGGGYLGDRTRAPKWVATAGYALSALSRLAMLGAHTLGTVIAVVTTDRLGKGVRTAPRDALIADASDPRMLGRAFGVHRTLDTIGAAVGPLLASALLLWVAGDYLVPGDYGIIFVASFGFAIVGVAVMVLFVPHRRRPAAQPTAAQPTAAQPAEAAPPAEAAVARPGLARPSLAGTVRQMVRLPLRRPLLAASLLALFSVGDGLIYLSLMDRDRFAMQYFPLLYVGTNIAYLALAIPLGRLADRAGRARVFLGGHLALLAGYLVVAGPSVGIWSVLLALVLLGTYYAATDGILPALVSPLVPDEIRGTGIAAAQTVVVVARAASSVAFGAAWDLFGRGASLVLMAGLLGLAVVVSACLLGMVAPTSRPAPGRSAP